MNTAPNLSLPPESAVTTGAVSTTTPVDGKTNLPRRKLSDADWMRLGACIAGAAYMGLDLAGRAGMFVGAAIGLLVALAPVIWVEPREKK